MKTTRIIFGIIKIPLDLLCTLAAFFLALKIRTEPSDLLAFQTPFDATVLPSAEAFFLFAVKGALLLIILFAVNNMYALKTRVPLSRELIRVISLTFAWVILIIAYFFVIHTFPFSRLVIAYTALFTTIFAIIERIILRLTQRALLKRGIGQYRVAVIGESTFAQEIITSLKHHPDYNVVGYIALHDIETLPDYIRRNHIEQITQAQFTENKTLSQRIIEICQEYHVHYSFVPDLLEVQRTNIEVSPIGAIPLIELKPTPLDGWGRVIKRIFDIVGGVIGIVIAAPFVIIAAIAIKLDSRGPIFFTRLDDGSPVQRIGQFGKPFNFYKLRTMQPNTHNLRYTLLAEQNTRKNSPLVKIKHDPRITRVGRILRRFSIDELPQLWNVVIGNISLVGPRAHLPEEVARYDKHHKFVLAIKPGISGLAQISGRSDLDFEEEVRLDTYYIQNWSLGLDLKILAKTIFAVLRGYEE